MLKSYLDLNFEVVHVATNNRYADCDNIKSVDFGPIALFSTYKLTTSSGRHLEEISHAHIVSSKYQLKTSAKIYDDLSIGFDRDRHRRQRELTNNRNQKGFFFRGLCLGMSPVLQSILKKLHMVSIIN